MSEEELEQRKKDDIKWVMSTEQGRRFVWDLLGVCGVYRSFEGDSDAMMIQEGSRRMGLHILGIITDADEDASFKMMLEAKNRKLEEDENANRTRESEAGPITVTDGPDAEYDSIIGGYDSGEFTTAFGESFF